MVGRDIMSRVSKMKTSMDEMRTTIQLMSNEVIKYYEKNINDNYQSEKQRFANEITINTMNLEPIEEEMDLEGKIVETELEVLRKDLNELLKANSEESLKELQ